MMLGRLCLCLLLLLLPAGLVHGHDGGFGHSRRTLFFALRDGKLVLEYRLLLTQDEAMLEMTQIDQDHDGRVTPEERDRYFQQRGGHLARGLRCQGPAGEPLPLTFVSYQLGQALAQTYTFTLSPGTEVLLDDRNFPHKPGVVQVRHGEGLGVELARPVDLTHAERVQLRIRRTNQP
jgi:hypothetical protein